jgi:hypothetical protein
MYNILFNSDLLTGYERQLLIISIRIIMNEGGSGFNINIGTLLLPEGNLFSKNIYFGFYMSTIHLFSFFVFLFFF